MRRSMGVRFRIGGLVAAALLLASCSTARAPEPVLGIAPNAAPRLVGADTPTRREHNRILKAYGGAYSDPALENLLTGIAAKVSQGSERPDIVYRITILNSPSVNAFALPTGDLYVTRGLLALASDSSEIAAVIAHEMGHVTARHAFVRADRERQAVLVSRVANDVLNDPEAGENSMAKARLALAKFSREQELEADALGIRTLAKAGYDPYGSVRFLSAMGRNASLKAASPGDQRQADVTSSHPATPERIQLALDAARATKAERAVTDRDAFLTALQGLVYGDDPSQGFVRGNRFIHPLLGFQFEAPAGFVLDNTSESIVGIGPDDTALRLDSVKVPANAPIGDYLGRDLMSGVETGPVENITINGFPAATTTATGRDWQFRMVGIRFGSDVYRVVYAARRLTPEQDALFRGSLLSFRRLSGQEAVNVRPQRVAVVRVGAGETVESLAGRMAFSDRQVERFLVLNGLNAGEALKSGSRVKLIVE
ncbi:M48 family metalloprotease [Terrihabitans rhizophilus]|uniref:M48 family metalloprotease n=1 Tax=Terrihabitans rhizophilus TaxID=3092662 RepID=A0ABU4RRJ8_9HYPH|nr:M48 family metalloprotease [Terrihabitans sp. PJ23]MDX6806803.1 M48 family metalloprotease [Terrihabitans sp. PJ23]